MKKIAITILAALSLAFMALPSVAQTYSAQSGVSFVSFVPATATAVSGAVRLPNFSGAGTLNITETGITGSPSGCTVTLKYQQNNATTATSAVSTTSFTPSTGIQTFTITPTTPASGDTYIATYACSSTYPTAGLISISFSPFATEVLANVPGVTDPCQNPLVLKQSVALSVATASTSQLIALAAGKAIYVCSVVDGSAGTTPSLQLLTGTGSACASNAANLTGAIPFTSGSVTHIDAGGGATTVYTPAGYELCGTTVGTGHYGVITYVQQ